MDIKQQVSKQNWQSLQNQECFRTDPNERLQANFLKRFGKPEPQRYAECGE